MIPERTQAIIDRLGKSIRVICNRAMVDPKIYHDIMSAIEDTVEMAIIEIECLNDQEDELD